MKRKLLSFADTKTDSNRDLRFLKKRGFGKFTFKKEYGGYAIRGVKLRKK